MQNVKINVSRVKKYMWQSILIIFCIFFEIEAGKNFYFPGQTLFRDYLAATSLALKKITQPIAHLNQLQTFKLMQDHPKVSIFSIFGTALTGILLHRSHTKISTYFMNLHTAVKAGLLTSLQKIRSQRTRLANLFSNNNPDEELHQGRHELLEAQQQLCVTQVALKSIKAKEASQQAEYDSLQQEIIRLKQLYEQATVESGAKQQALTEILTNLIKSFSSAKDQYMRESKQFTEQTKAWLAEKNSLLEKCATAESKLVLLDRLYKEQEEKFLELKSKNATYEAELSVLRTQRPHHGVSLAKSDGAPTDGIPVVSKSEGTYAKGARSSGLILPQPLRTCSPLQDPVQKRSLTDNPEHHSPKPARVVDLEYGKIIEEAQSQKR